MVSFDALLFTGFPRSQREERTFDQGESNNQSFLVSRPLLLQVSSHRTLCKAHQDLPLGVVKARAVEGPSKKAKNDDNVIEAS